MSVMLFPEYRSLSWGIEEEGHPHMCGWASPHPTAQQEKKKMEKGISCSHFELNSHLLFLPSIRAPGFQTFILTWDFKNPPQIWGLRGEAETKLLTRFPEPQLLDS